MKTIFATTVLASGVLAIKFGLPGDEGLMIPEGDRETLMDNEGEVNLHAVVDTDNEPDSNEYPGEDEEREAANDQILRFKNGHRKPKIVRSTNLKLNNADLWEGADDDDGAMLLQTGDDLPHDEGMMMPYGEDSIMDDEGEVNLHAVVNEDDEPDANTYPGEDEEMERANDEVLRFKLGHRKPKIAPRQHTDYSTDDLWGEN